MALAVFLIAIILGIANAQSLDPIVIKGTKLFYKTNGTQFFVRGVTYQQGYGLVPNQSTTYTDPLADVEACNRDIAYLARLRTNVIHVRAISPTNNHTSCLAALAAAGMYLLADLGSPRDLITNDPPSWNLDIYNRYTSVVDSLASYDNVLGFLVSDDFTDFRNASSYTKAAVRDVKAYIKQKRYRAIPIGYASEDTANTRYVKATYMTCGNKDDAVDFYGFNTFSWCGDSTLTQSGWGDLTTRFSAIMTVPLIMTAYGCTIPKPRLFTEVQALYGASMSGVWSGGIAYQWFSDSTDYGLATVSGNSVSLNKDFENLSSRIRTADPSSTVMSAYSPTNTVAPACPAVNGTIWPAIATPLPPTPNDQLCNCMYGSLTCAAASQNSYSDLVSYVCGTNPRYCSGVSTNITTGQYGDYSVCNTTQQVGFLANQAASSLSCNFNGLATTKASQSTNPTCSVYLAQAGLQGTGSITSTPTAANSGSATASSTGSSSGSGSGGSSGGNNGNSSGSNNSTALGLGIGLGLGIPLLAAVVGALFFFRRRKAKEELPPKEEPNAAFDKAELPGQGAERSELSGQNATGRHAELGSHGEVVEVNGASKPIEIGGRDVAPSSPAELEGNWHGTEAGITSPRPTA